MIEKLTVPVILLQIVGCLFVGLRQTAADVGVTFGTQNFDRVLIGRIDNTIEVRMRLHRSGTVLSGSYSYRKYGTDIPIQGSIDSQGAFVVKEYGAKDGSQTGTFEGRFVSASEIAGTWYNVKGNRRLTFSLAETPAATTSPAAAPTTDSKGSSYLPIALPFVILLLVFAARLFHAIATTDGPPGCMDIVFTLFATIIISAIVGGIGGAILFGINEYSPDLAWVLLLTGITTGGLLYLRSERRQAAEMEARKRQHEAWEARHRDDLCDYCDAFRTIDGEVHHMPSCGRR